MREFVMRDWKDWSFSSTAETASAVMLLTAIVLALFV
jgi:hypothetical protein